MAGTGMTMVVLELLDRTGRPIGVTVQVDPRQAAGMIARRAAIPADDDDPDDLPDSDPDAPVIPGVSPVRELLWAVNDGRLTASQVLAAEQARDRPRQTILDRLGT